MTTELTKRQHRALDRLGASNPDAKVIGWIEHRDSFMPVIEIHTGPFITTTLAVDRRGAMSGPTKYFFTEHTVTTNLELTHYRGTYEVIRHA